VSITDREFDLLVGKFGFETRQGDHLFAWLIHNGKLVLRTRRSNKKGSLPMEHAIRQQMKLSADELRDAIACTLDRASYIALLVKKGVIEQGGAEPEP
jgi:hypothetical protein